jgi:hypothetical protein
MNYVIPAKRLELLHPRGQQILSFLLPSRLIHCGIANYRYYKELPYIVLCQLCPYNVKVFGIKAR